MGFVNVRPAAWVVALTALGAGCGGGGSTLPAAPSGTVVSIAVASSGATIYMGASEVFTAVATYSSGGSETIRTGAWSTDAPSIATVELGTGKVTGVGSGNVTVSVDYQGVRGSRTVRSQPNYSGVWNADSTLPNMGYTVTSCDQTEGFADANVCSNFTGKTLPFAFQFSQTVDVLSGNTILGQVGTTNFTSTVQLDGSVTVISQAFLGTTIEIDVEWDLICKQAGTIGGTMTQTWQDQATTGRMIVKADLHPPTRIAAALATSRARLARPASLADVVAAVVRR